LEYSLKIQELLATKTKWNQLNETASALEGNLDKMRQNWMSAKQTSERFVKEIYRS
jgi:hypothetical protein